LAKHAHALLVKAGMAIAPDAFAEAIGSASQNDTNKSRYQLLNKYFKYKLFP